MLGVCPPFFSGQKKVSLYNGKEGNIGGYKVDF
jgi:hypothetical protein